MEEYTLSDVGYRRTRVITLLMEYILYQYSGLYIYHIPNTSCMHMYAQNIC